ncbi:MAG: ABC transporter ATP-binding protein [Deltaproteobacteria bacterium]|nr:ABC transporter ATP-binding protein [Deltaproteobacteria bacterium]MBW1920735.1 ABC transporter ATP-binding protein [Deltaproteobacteria bacterium]MBW1934938.1 ABC transporter ATP-binding protein [Deltaproteobacteria bacterium]MBW1977174.1 ABC transporter ATP-binding protein [Deltaproteobacteria bacterium]MBW2045600.1 ABC transporter ATP-binding protein [Deltaproteobacteria bacterium]
MICYDHLTKIYGEGKNAVTALEDVTFSIEKGQTVILLGPSGCGKTTLLRCTNRLESITRGEILVHGQDIMDMDVIQLRRQMGYVIQDIGLFPNKTIADNIGVVPKLIGWDSQKIAARVDELLTMVRLEPEVFRSRYPVELSGGQQQRVGVARALAADPDILLMDEPFAAIDPINREQIQNEFLKLQEHLEKTIVFVSHDIHEAVKMGDKIALFDKGRLVQYDTPEILLTRPKNKYVADFVGADRALKVLGIILAKDIVNLRPRDLVKGEDSAEDVLKMMEEKGLSHAIVIAHGKPLGYVTPQKLKYKKGQVRDLVEKYPVHISERTPARDILSYMLMLDFFTLYVVDENGEFIGTVAYNDIKKKVKESYAGDLKTD